MRLRAACKQSGHPLRHIGGIDNGAAPLGETTVDSSGAYEVHFVVPLTVNPGRGEILIDGSTRLAPCDRPPSDDSSCPLVGEFSVTIK